MKILRFGKALSVASLAIFALLTGISNIADHQTNFPFVQHVLSMDTIFPGSALKARAILNPFVWTLAFWAIIATEFLTGLLLAIGSIQLARNIGNPNGFVRAKCWVYGGCSLGFLLWFFGFIVIGGEWFGMWQSGTWNGIESAFRFVMVILAVLILVAMPEQDSH